MARGQSVCRILQIDPLGNVTCAGLNKRGTGCGCLVARSSRERAYAVLRTVASFSSDSRELKHVFREAAGLLLCKRWHQHQWRSIVGDWLDLWREEEELAQDSGYSSADNEDYRSRTVRTISYNTDQSDEDEEPASSRTQGRRLASVGQRQSSVAQPSANWQTAYEALLSSVLNSDLSSDTRVAILQTALSSPSSRSVRSASTPTQTRNRFLAIEAAPTRQSSTQPPRRTPSSLPALTISTPTASPTSRRASTATHSPQSASPEHRPSATHTTTTPVSTSRHSEPASPTAPPRHSHIECPICMCSYTDGDEEEFFECSTCLNRTHLSCHRQWATIDPRTTTCTFW